MARFSGLGDLATLLGSLEEEFADDDFEDEEPEDEAPLKPEEQLRRMLTPDSMPHLREIARNRGIKVTARNKAELLERLPPLLAERDSIIAAIAKLDADQVLALHITDILSAAFVVDAAAINRGVQGFGRTIDTAAAGKKLFTPLADLALIVKYSAPYGPSGYAVPAIVSAHLPPRADLLKSVSTPMSGSGRERSVHLGLYDLLPVLVHEFMQGRIGRTFPALSPEEVYGLPGGWKVAGGEKGGYNRPVTLELQPPLLPPGDIMRLVNSTGASPHEIDFALTTLQLFGIVEPVPGVDEPWEVYPDRLATLLNQPLSQRVFALLQLWENNVSGAFDLGMAVGKNRPVQFHYRTAYGTIPEPPIPAIRRMLARILGRLPHGDTWYSVSSLLDLFHRLTPDLLIGQSWWFTARGRQERLNLKQEGEWRQVWEPIISAMLTGPLSWLGLVEVAADRERAVAVRPTQFSDLLVGRGILPPAPTGGPALTIDSALAAGCPVVTLRPRADAEGVYAFLTDVGELAEIKPSGLRYHLTRSRLHEVFNGGLTGPDVLHALQDYSGGPVHPRVRTAIEHWWRGYGAVRLYDDVTLIELGEDTLLPELLAASDLREAVVYTFSPRLVAVQPSRADALIANLTRLGYTPRVVGGA